MNKRIYEASFIFLRYLIDYEKLLNIKSFDDVNESNIKDIITEFNLVNKNDFLVNIFDHLNFIIREDELKEKIDIIKNIDFSNKNSYERVFKEINYHSKNASSPFISKVIYDIIKNENRSYNNILDPTMGYGNFLIDLNKKLNVNIINGIEVDYTTFNLAKMNFYLRGLNNKKLNITNIDSLLETFKEESSFDLIISDPPLIMPKEKYDNLIIKNKFDEYYDYPKTSLSDFSFILNNINKLSDDGIYITTAHPRLLFRDINKDVREKIVEENLIDTIIRLPRGIYYNPFINIYILFFKMNKKTEDIFIIDYQNESITKSNEERLLYEIKDIYNNKLIIKDRSKYIHKQEIIDNDYNLNLTRYQNKILSDNIDLLEKIEENKKFKKKLNEKIVITDDIIHKLLK